jgi:hypothetical protein
VVSAEDTAEIWEAAKKETIEKVRGNKNRSARAESPMVDKEEEERSFHLIRTDVWVITGR